jgi:hypothetical protein
MNPNMTLACPAYLHGFVPVQDLQDWKLVEDVKAQEKTTYTQLTTRSNDDRPRQEPSPIPAGPYCNPRSTITQRSNNDKAGA